ncbi:MAG TPA: glycosyltransferase family 2 protein [Lysobacter sp.]|nr:glycosyltransferase family 2 protein [Lysobacter sp.]
MNTDLPSPHAPLIAVVIPAYRVTAHVRGVVETIGQECGAIYVVDDSCPDGSGDVVSEACRDLRVTVLRHDANQGVGGAVMTGYRQAIRDGASVIVKIDGDGQMDPQLISTLVAPILAGEADYCKGNRFFDLRRIDRMPLVRRLGNLALSFMSKVSTGYGMFSIRPTASPPSTHRSPRACRSKASAVATSSKPTCCSASTRCVRSSWTCPWTRCTATSAAT